MPPRTAKAATANSAERRAGSTSRFARPGLAADMRRAASWLGSPSVRRGFCADAAARLPRAQALRPFLVEQYHGWTDPAVEFPSLSSSECEPLSLQQLLALADDDSLRQWEALSLGYPAFNAGSLWLRQEIAALYSDVIGPAQVNVLANLHPHPHPHPHPNPSPKQVNVLAPQEGIYLAMRALLSPGAHVVVTSPCYQVGVGVRVRVRVRRLNP